MKTRDKKTMIFWFPQQKRRLNGMNRSKSKIVVRKNIKTWHSRVAMAISFFFSASHCVRQITFRGLQTEKGDDELWISPSLFFPLKRRVGKRKEKKTCALCVCDTCLAAATKGITKTGWCWLSALGIKVRF